MMRRTTRVTAVLAVASSLGLAVSTDATAKVTHPLVSSFNGGEAPLGPLGPPLASDAVDQGSGEVYVLEANLFGLVGHDVVDKFDENGVYAGVQIVGTPRESFAFGVASGVAVDNSLGANNGDVYVADTGHDAVDRFDSEGNFVCKITGKTPISTEEVEDECAGAGGSNTPNGSLTPTGMTVDSSGDVYVADDAHSVVDEFGPAGDYIRQIESTQLTGTMGELALDASGNLYVTNLGSDVVKFDALGEFVAVLDSASATGVAVDPAPGGHVYVSGTADSHAQVAEYEPSGVLVDVFHPAAPELHGLAVDGTTGRIYVVEFLFVTSGGGTVEIFGPGLVVPDVTTGAATNVQRTSATLSGQVDPDVAHGGGEITECEFEYVTDTQFQEHAGDRYEGAATVDCSPAAPLSSATGVSADVSASPSTTYHFRLKAANASGVSQGEDETFTTPGPPAIDEEAATVMSTDATVRALIDPFNVDTTCHVQYVDDASFELSGYDSATTLPCEPADLGAGFTDRGASVVLRGLGVGVTYHYRFIATSQAGSVAGADMTFATFGLGAFDVEVRDREGHPYTQAGGHPYELVTRFDLNTTTNKNGEVLADANVKDVQTELPPGFLGNPAATARCSRDELANFQCSGASQVGVLHVRGARGNEQDVPVYNLVPPANTPAEFGAVLSTVSVYIDANVRTGGDYGITADVANVSTAIGVTSVSLELWGVPADPSHDTERECPLPAGAPGSPGEAAPCSANEPETPFLTNPTSCLGPQTATLRVDSWQDVGAFVTAASTLPEMTGCERLDFTPAITLQPDTSAADSASGLHVDIRVPQTQSVGGLAEANVRRVTVVLPPGMSVSPSAAGGLGACAPAQIGLDDDKEATCPGVSRIGTVEIDTPLLPDPLRGSVYLAEQNANPFNSLLAIYVTAQADGALIKLAGHVVADPVTGQLTTTFDDDPQLPFSEFKLTLFGGSRGALATPESCGAVAASALLTPWNGATPASLFNDFQFVSGCVDGFAPDFTAGSTKSAAGAYSPFVLSFSRADDDQELSGLRVALPPGLLAKITGVPLCSDADADAGSCPEASQVGSVNVAIGPGGEPFFLTGKAYLTGAYKGAPYGLVVVVPAIAGPFDLGNVVVREALEIDHVDAHVTAVSDAFPTILNGIPIRLRRVDVLIDRPLFTFNPTSCDPEAVAGALTSTVGVSAPVSSPFRAADCSQLPFKPRFGASTQAQTSKAQGASLRVKVTSSSGQANIREAKVALPKQLPSRLTTLQKACPDGVFNANPGSCPPASIVGSATVVTSVLPSPLRGPAYLVSHGGEAFPGLTIVLQGDGVTLVLDGTTNIKKGITTATFGSVPDAPITSFELVLPEGPHSLFATNLLPKAKGNMCGQNLAMPTTLTGQNGALITQSTKIAVSGCPRHKKKHKRAQKRKRGRKKFS
jgi:hypothetical protein